ncbi:hypothetical protein D3C80_1358780 [compost metagenome]
MATIFSGPNCMILRWVNSAPAISAETIAPKVMPYCAGLRPSRPIYTAEEPAITANIAP